MSPENQIPTQTAFTATPDGLCTLPWSGLTINPDGNIVVCCSSVVPTIKHISEVENLQTFFRESLEYQGIRQSFIDNEFPKECFTCRYKKSRGLKVQMDGWPKSIIPNNVPPRNLNNEQMPILYLDLSVSNVCNQTCVMCGPLYSSKWFDLENKIRAEIAENKNSDMKQMYIDGREGRGGFNDAPKLLSISEKDFQKILKILPTVEVIHLKGGEPLVEKRNLQIIKETSKYKTPPRIQITTNLSVVSDEAWNAIENYPKGKMNITVSIDGVNRQFEWIRGGNFQSTMNNIERLCKTGHRVHVRMSPTLHASFNLGEQIKNVYDNTSIRQVEIGLVTSPMYASTRLIPPALLKDAQDKTKEAIQYYEKKSMKIKDHGWFSIKSLFDHDTYDKFLTQANAWTKFFNKQRGINIQDHVPELKSFLKLD
jgi:MoaA/NifB/PqqE/SkfB family radical SAM enzyme